MFIQRVALVSLSKAKFFETGIKVVDYLAPYAKKARMAIWRCWYTLLIMELIRDIAKAYNRFQSLLESEKI